MGIKGLSSNRRRSLKCRKSTKWQRTLKAEKKKQLPAESVSIENVHLFSKEKLKNKLRNPKNNIKISGKKLRRLTKRLGHSLKEKSLMDVEVTDTRPVPRKAQTPQDAVMTETDTSTVPTGISLPVQLAPTSSKKKKRGKKSTKNDTSKGEKQDEQLFENDDGWEDVDMEANGV
uniref:Uncharacterized protein n=2 Tax=Arion vulgaris TaxID=1028688 RepID=A0A0B6ZR66_9EUPU